MNTTFLVDVRIMRIAVLMFILFGHIPVAMCATPIGFARFEGGWGYVSSDPEDSWLGAGFRGGVAACGAPKQLMINIREETLADGSRELRLRLHADQLAGAVITSISDVRLTTEFLGESDIFELHKDGRLVMTRNGTRLLFTRC